MRSISTIRAPRGRSAAIPEDDRSPVSAALGEKLGLDEAEERSNDSCDRLAELCEKIASRTAQTIAGLQAKGRAQLLAGWGGHYPPENGDNGIPASLVRDLVGEEA
jgi:hypothetical protein